MRKIPPRQLGTLHRNFRQNLREIREKKGLSQQYVGDQLGLARSRIADLERGRSAVNGPTLDTVERVAWVLGVTSVRLLRTPKKKV